MSISDPRVPVGPVPAAAVAGVQLDAGAAILHGPVAGVVAVVREVGGPHDTVIAGATGPLLRFAVDLRVHRLAGTNLNTEDRLNKEAFFQIKLQKNLILR